MLNVLLFFSCAVPSRGIANLNSRGLLLHHLQDSRMFTATTSLLFLSQRQGSSKNNFLGQIYLCSVMLIILYIVYGIPSVFPERTYINLPKQHRLCLRKKLPRDM